MQNNKPITSKRLGRFQISTWNHVYIHTPKEENWFECERVYESVRARILYGRYNRKTGQFDRRQIWCSLEELRVLADLRKRKLSICSSPSSAVTEALTAGGIRLEAREGRARPVPHEPCHPKKEQEKARSWHSGQAAPKTTSRVGLPPPATHRDMARWHPENECER